MKYFVVFVSCFLATVQAGIVPNEQKTKIKEYHKACLEETKADEALVQKASKGEFVDDPKLKQQLFCFSKKAGFQNEAGEILTDNVVAKINAIVKDDGVAKSIAAKCVVKKDTPEDTAFEAIKCLHQFSPDEDVLN